MERDRVIANTATRSPYSEICDFLAEKLKFAMLLAVAGTVGQEGCVRISDAVGGRDASGRAVARSQAKWSPPEVSRGLT